MTPKNLQPTLFAASLAAVFGCAISGAQISDPLLQQAEMAMRPDEFLISSEQDEARLSYDTRRDVRICNRTRKAEGIVGPTDPTPKERAVTLEIEHGGRTEKVDPGNCTVVQAKSLTISSADPLEPGWMLTGSVETGELGTLSGRTERKTRTAAAEPAAAERSAATEQSTQRAHDAGMAQQAERTQESSGQASATADATASGAKVEPESVIIQNWPETSRKAAETMIAKYGSPEEVTRHRLVWHDNGRFKRTTVIAEEIDHDFPMPHKDVLEQVVNYEVPPGKFDELAEFDGSVIVDRTRGEISARCDKEAANLLALNLAHDIVTGRRSVAEARDFYARSIQQMMDGQMTAYVQRLQFNPPEMAGFSDQPSPIIRQAAAEPSDTEAREGEQVERR